MERVEVWTYLRNCTALFFFLFAARQETSNIPSYDRFRNVRIKDYLGNERYNRQQGSKDQYMGTNVAVRTPIATYCGAAHVPAKFRLWHMPNFLVRKLQPHHFLYTYSRMMYRGMRILSRPKPGHRLFDREEFLRKFAFFLLACLFFILYISKTYYGSSFVAKSAA